MKVGIMTWFYGDNYGARAHSYALQQTIRELGHECIMISIFPPHLFKMNFRMNLNYKNRKQHPVLAMRCLMRNYNFYKARKQMYNSSKIVKNAAEIDAIGCDLIILGSDEVFKVEHPYFNKLFYGVGIKTQTISYAPSAGQTPVNYVLSSDIKEAIMKIKSLSVRDHHTYELIKNNTGREAEIVLDPTMIYDFSDMAIALPENKYVLVYSFDTLDEYKERIKEYSEKRNLKIISIGRYCSWADKSYDSIDVRHWLGAYKNAELVITDSFHGTVFSIKNNKRFVILGREDKLNKINDLMLDCGVSLQFYNGNYSIEEYLKQPFFYEEIENTLNLKKKVSIQFLKNALNEVQR